jgi:hypothetical protein
MVTQFMPKREWRYPHFHVVLDIDAAFEVMAVLPPAGG